MAPKLLARLQIPVFRAAPPHRSIQPESWMSRLTCRRSQGVVVIRSPAGAEASAMLYTLIETVKANDLEPHAYLHFLFETLPNARHGNELNPTST